MSYSQNISCGMAGPAKHFLLHHNRLVTGTDQAENTRPERVPQFIREGANKQVISSQADSLIKISRIWADFFPANTSNQPI